MKRFNLLLVSGEASIGDRVLKTLGKVYRNNFVFEVDSMGEARKLLSKLNIHLMLVDLNKFEVNLEELADQYPQTVSMGIHSSKSTISSVLEPFRAKIYRRDLVGAELFNDLKLMKKQGPGVPFGTTSRPSSSPQFRDFSKLVKQSNN